ncbi:MULTISPECIES: glycosyltransferase family 4 protein [Bacteroides]|uniref:glycosyltransferase family 4 protein n=2 Tax=Bacteroides TaxID=816 RepID=UPI00033808A2|nr:MULTISPECIES: glycosyltransferase family 1 protein [Bacteroides]KAB5347105.1 glycosyltransferase family 4 protein [Bacteroides salyersiae]KAB5351393.1 glycosyltransferase family 4 protein [Bacteroides salyersiae]KAB5351602.1 glycosyltransferase family 4 protein [Bacteroides salyersiae]KAB5366375.1 glycosyltransferase family 4 protein [Bacteroides salyersiae]KAB5367512.1 glycosyltransferase family 4 protein [Bacteroides salyersiae]
MKIAIEAQRIFRPNKHGMDFVALETIRELQKIDHENEYFIFVSPGPDHCLNESDNMHIVELRCPSYPLWEQVALPRAVARVRPDLLHCTSNTAPVKCPVPLVLTLHDIIFLEKRQSSSRSLYQEMGWHYRRLVVPRILSECRKIITVSNFECNRIREALNLPKDRLTAVYNGYSPHFRQMPPAPEIVHKYVPSDDYLFFLGNTDPKKNTPRVLKAYGLYLRQSKHKRPLLIADLKEEAIDGILSAEGIKEVKPYLSFPGYIPNADLAALYNGAFAFLYPSLRESFGIPMLESMACGTPVIAGNTSAMPEIAGEGALLADPLDENDIARKILLLEEDDTFYQQQVDYGLERVKLFSWRKSAEALLKIYKEIIIHKPQSRGIL